MNESQSFFWILFVSLLEVLKRFKNTVCLQQALRDSCVFIITVGKTNDTKKALVRAALFHKRETGCFSGRNILRSNRCQMCSIH